MMHQKMMMNYMYVIRAALAVLCLNIVTCSVAYQQQQQQQQLNFTEMKQPTNPGPTIYLPVAGNVYPLGGLTTRIIIGVQQPKQFVVDIDTGSDLTWVACAGAYPTPTNPYTPRAQDVIKCHEPECRALGGDVTSDCTSSSPSNDPCRYTVSYVDGSMCKGVLVRALFPFRLTNGTTIARRLIFGCGLHSLNDRTQIGDGVLGLGKGNSGILKQLNGLGVTQKAVGHCFTGLGDAARGGGYLLVGDFPVLPGMVWKQVASSNVHYYMGKADMLFDGRAAPEIKGLDIIFDSGSTYTYVTPLAYIALLERVKRNLMNGSPLTLAADDRTLPICWGISSTPIASVDEVSRYFQTLALSFVGDQNLRYEIPPKSYLIRSEKGNVCLGIMDVQEETGEEDINIIGDISMFGKLVIYDNQNGRVGWATSPTNCI